MDENEITELKLRINHFIWENAPAAMTLEEAEKAAVALLESMVPGSTDSRDVLLNAAARAGI